MDDHSLDKLNLPGEGKKDCPPPDALAAFLAGAGDFDRSVIESHLLDCDRCVEVLGRATAEDENLEVPRLVMERAAALVPHRSNVRAFLHGPGALPRTALAAAAALAFAFVGYHVGQVNAGSGTDAAEFIHVVSFESINSSNVTDNLESILLAQVENRP